MFLKLSSNFNQGLQAARRKIPMYWQDKMVNQIIAANQEAHEKEMLIIGTIMGIRRDVNFPDNPLVIPGLNIVTNDGDVYYAEMSAGQTPTDDFDGGSAGLRLGSSNTSPTKTDTDVTTFLSGTGKALTAGYPNTADADSDNTGSGADVATWQYAYTTAQGNTTGIQEGAIVDDITTPTAALTHFLFAALFDKTSSDTLKVIVNHTFNGV